MRASSPKAKPEINTKALPIGGRMLALEPRFVFDAAMASELDGLARATSDVAPVDMSFPEHGSTIVAAANALAAAGGSPATDDTSQRALASERSIEWLVAAHNLAPSNREIAFIDGRLADIGTLIAAVPDGTRIVLVDPSRDGVGQMAEALRGQSGITGIHILSHGSEGRIELGGSVIDADTMSTIYRSALASMAANLSADADILVYGCNFAAGETGARAVAMLAGLTGADVAASEDLTGGAANADWDLEARTGAIEAQTIAARAWDELMAPLNISVGSAPIVTGTGAVGTTALWLNAGTIGGTPIDLRATVMSLTTLGGLPFFGTLGDDAFFQLTQQGNATLRWEIFAAGTSQTVYAVGTPEFRIADIDGIGGVFHTRESVTPSLNHLTSFTRSTPTNLVVSVSGSAVEASGTQDQNGEASSLVGFVWNDVSSWEITYTLHINSPSIQARFLHDGDGDFAFVDPNTTMLLALDLDGNNSAAAGTAYQTTFTENGAAVPVVDADATISQHVALGTSLDQARVVLTNAQAGDVLSVGALPAGITAIVDTGVGGQITVTLSGNATVADYEAALEAITFSNAGENPSTIDRSISVDVTNATFGTTSNQAISTIHVNAVNDAPVASPDLATTPEDTTLIVSAANGLLANDTDLDGGPLAVTQFTVAGLAGTFSAGQTATIAGVGALTINADGSYQFVPALNYSGPVPVATYTVSDGAGGAVTSTLTLDVTPVNDPPVAIDDGPRAVTEDTPLTVAAAAGLLVNDSDVDGGPLSVAGFTVAGDPALHAAGSTAVIPGIGTLLINADGGYTFTPEPNYAAQIPLVTHTITDGSATDTATLTLTMSAVNDPPSASPDMGTTPEDTTLTVSAANGLLVNDTDLDGGPLAVTQFTVAGLAGTFSAGQTATIAGVGALTINADGSYQFVPALNYSGPVPVPTYTVSDGAGGTVTSTLTLDVTPVNDPPVAIDDGPRAVTEDTPVIVQAVNGLLVNDSDVDGGPLSVTQFVVAGDPTVHSAGSTALMPGIGTLLINENGSYAFVPAANYNGPIPVITYTITDGNGGSDTAALTLGPVAPVTDPPLALNDTAPAVEDTPVAGNVLGNDSDPDNDPLTVVQFAVPGAGVFAAGAPALIPGVGMLVIDPDGSFTFTPVANYVGPVPVATYTITDGTAAATATLTIGPIAPVNDAPLPVADTNATAEDTPLTVAAAQGVLANDLDIDGGALSVTGFTVAGVAGTFSPGQAAIIPGVGSLTINADGSYTFAPVANFNGPVPVATYSLSDGAGGTASTTLAITVTPVSDPPVIDLDDDRTPVNLIVNGDFENGLAGWTSAYGLTGANVSGPHPITNASFQTATLADHTFGDATGEALFIDTGFPTGFTGSLLEQTVTLIAGETYTFEAYATSIFPVQAPVVEVSIGGNVIATQVLPVDQSGTWQLITVTFTATATGPVTLSIRDTNPNGGGNDFAIDDISLMGIDPATIGTGYETTFHENGAGVAIADPSVAIADIDDTNIESGVIVLTNAQPGDELALAGSLPAGIAHAIDTSVAGQVTITLTGSAPLADYETAIAAIRFSNSTDDPSLIDRTINVTVNDGDFNSNTAVAIVHVVPVNDAPDAVDDATATGFGVPVVVGLLGNDSDPDGDPLTVVSATVPPAQGTVILVGGDWVFTPAAGFSGVATITYTIADQDGATDTAVHTVTVANAPPTLVDPDPAPGTPSIDPTDPSRLLVPAVDGVPLMLPLAGYFADPNADPLTITPDLAALPAWLTWDPVAGTLSGTPPADNTGPVTIPVTVSDGHGGGFTATIVIGPTNPAPDAIDDATATGFGVPVVVGLLGNDSDPDGDPLTVVSATVPPAQGTVILVGGDWVFTPAAGFSGVATITYIIADQDGATDTAVHTVTVANAPPTLVDPDPAPGTPSIDPTDPSRLLVPAVDGVPLMLPLAGYFADPNADPLTITPDLAALPAWLTWDPVAGTLSGTPPADNTGPVTIPVTVSDGHGGGFTATIVIGPTNPGPDAIDDATATGFGVPVVVGLLGNDSDPDGDPLTVVSATVPPAQGTVAFDGGDWVFTPAAGFSGVATITYTMADQDGATDTAVHTVTVGLPVAPIAVNDAYSTLYAVPVNGDVRTGDSYFPGSTFQALSQPMNGALSFNTDGTFTYTPAPGFLGTDTFIYQVRDPAGQTAFAVEVIRVNPPALVAIADAATTPFGEALHAGVSGNDSFAAGSTFFALTAPGHGTVAMNADGTYVYTPMAGFSGTDMFAYAVTDPAGQTRIATVLITVAPPPALIAVDDAAATDYRTPVDGNAAAGDTFEPGSIFAAASQPTHGSLVFNSDGTYTYTPAAGFAGGDTFTYRVTDIHGQTALATETITVAPPALAADDEQAATGYVTPVSGDVARGDTFVAGSTFAVAGQPGHGTVAMNPDGTFTYTPAAGFAGTDSFTYRVTDPTGQSVIATVTIAVAPPALVAVDDAFAAVYGVPVPGGVSAGDTFAPGSTFSVAGLPGHGTVAMNPDGTFTYTPAAGFTGTDTFTYRVTDPTGQSVVATATLIISPPGLVAADDHVATAFNVPVEGNAALGDTFVAGSTFAVAEGPSVGTVSMRPNGSFTYTPPADFAGTTTFTYRVTDPTGQVRAATVTVTVSAPALIAVDDRYSTPYATALAGNAAAGDTYPAGSVFAVSVGPAHGSVNMNADGTYQYLPAAGFSGSDTFTYSITGPTGQRVTAIETITVEPRTAAHRCLTTFGSIASLRRR